eukprot:snap_masked-scaffold_99-processed-gene-0.9-mRNA-1 protein AED:1.00 eAED:1.00 QI:0/0/0/0/1/1/5/0/86
MDLFRENNFTEKQLQNLFENNIFSNTLIKFCFEEESISYNEIFLFNLLKKFKSSSLKVSEKLKKIIDEHPSLIQFKQLFQENLNLV